MEEQQLYCGFNCECTGPEDCHAQPVINLVDIFQSEKSFQEDYQHENGQYLNTCMVCQSTFAGYKRRVVCKVCTNEGTK